MDIKNLNKKINKNTQIIILAIMSMLYIFSSVYGLNTAYDYISNFIVVTLVLMAVWALFINVDHSNFASYFVLLMLGFIDHVSIFIRWLFSFNIDLGFTGSFPWLSFILVPFAIYSAIMAISVFLDEGFEFNRECFNLDQLIILFPILMFLTYGINVLIAVLVVEFVACNYRPIASHFLMLSKTIVIPLSIVTVIFQGGASFLSLGNWLLSILAIYVIILISKDLIMDYKRYKHFTGEVCEDCNNQQEVIEENNNQPEVNEE